MSVGVNNIAAPDEAVLEALLEIARQHGIALTAHWLWGETI